MFQDLRKTIKLLSYSYFKELLDDFVKKRLSSDKSFFSQSCLTKVSY